MILIYYVFLSLCNTTFADVDSLKDYINSDFSTKKIYLNNGGEIKFNNNDGVFDNCLIYTNGTVKKTKKFNFGRFDSAIIELPDAKVLIAGGRNQVIYPSRLITRPRSSTVIYDPETNSFEDGSYMVIPRVDHQATHLPDGKILITGGQKLKTDGKYSKLLSTEIYDPDTKTFSKNTNMLVRHANHDAVLLRNNKVLITDQDIGFAELYDPEKKKFKLIKWFPLSYQQKTVLLPNKNALTASIILDENGDDPYHGRIELWEFDSTLEIFKKISSATLESIKQVLFIHAEVLSNNKVLVKYVVYSPAPLACGVIYDPVSKLSTKAGCYPLKERFQD